jgi:Phage integrase, N-terminal
MRDLNYQLKLLCKHSHEGSFETRVGRERQLSAIANQLHELGFRQMTATSLKQKHAQTLVDLWLKKNLSPGTIKNRMSCLRWWAEKVNKRAVVAGSNDFYGIPDRQFVSDHSKAKDLAEEQLALVKYVSSWRRRMRTRKSLKNMARLARFESDRRPLRPPGS